MQLDWAGAASLLFTAVFASFAGLLALALMQGQVSAPRTGLFTQTTDGTEFLFDGETLVDATPAARALIATSPVRGGAWFRLVAYLVQRFPDLEPQLARLPVEGRIRLAASQVDTALMLVAELRGGLTHISVVDQDRSDQGVGHDPLAQRAILDELALLREAAAQAPTLMWRERADGEVVWANAAYLKQAVAGLAAGQDLAWPLPRLFERTAVAQGAQGQRQRIERSTGAPAWFELMVQPDGQQEAGGRLVFALPADSAVQAESALREFMQTLTKTFAHLPIGLAIFDRQRQLQLFNPALLDLTGLPPDFLSLRPSLHAVLDAMRDRSMIPEPKDYRTWRRDMADLEKAAATGVYEETWSLPSGQTYRVIGRPHPNGALALMFEDISTEMSRTRRYRADLELGQSVVDQLQDAIAVFSQAGHLVMSNAAYAGLWDHDPADTLADAGIASLAAHWRARCAPSPVWAMVEDFVVSSGDRKGWTADVRLLDGRLVEARATPLAGGAGMIAFHATGPDEGVLPEFASARLRKAG